MRAVILLIVLLAATAGPTLRAASPPELEPLAFLLGNWVPVGGTETSGASGEAEFTRGLQERIILRSSYAEYPAAAGRPASRHEDLMIIYAAAAGALRAEYYDNEGHVIRYVVRVPEANRAIFTSEPGPGEPTFRLSYELGATGVMKGAFDIAPPGAPDAFQSYLVWESKKAAAPAK